MCEDAINHFMEFFKKAFVHQQTGFEIRWHTRRKPDFVFRRNGSVHLNRRGRQLSRLLAAEVRASAVVMLDTPCSEVVWSVLATHSTGQFPLHFPFRASPCAITFQLHSSTQTSHPMWKSALQRLKCVSVVRWLVFLRGKFRYIAAYKL